MKITYQHNLYAEEQSLEDLDLQLAKGGLESKCRYMLRGEPDSNFKLKTSFFRETQEKSISLLDYYGKHNFDEEKFDRNALIGNCGILFFDSRYENLDRFPQFASTMILQHTGIFPTPFLDISYHIFAPLYFACKSYKDKDGNDLYSNKDGRILLFGTTGIDIKDAFSVYLINPNIPTPLSRMMKQNGAFIATFKISDNKTYFCDISESKNLYANSFIIPSKEKPKFIGQLESKFGNLKEYFGI